MKFFEKDNLEADPENELNIHLLLHDALAREMSDDMNSSYQSYLRYNEKYEKL
jgi:hypothetical protein